MKQVVRNFVRGVLGFALRQVYGGIGCILAFHRVAPMPSGPRVGNVMMEISTENLEALIQHLTSNGYVFTSMDEVHEILTGRRKSRRFVAFTFDDGYVDSFTLARPIFQKYNVPFTVNVVPWYVGNTNALWWYRLEHLLLRQDHVSFRQGSECTHLETRSHSEKENAFELICRTVRKLVPEERRSFLEELFAGENDFAKRPLLMDWDQIKELSADPLVTIGAHTTHHFDLNRLSPEEIRSEINDSRSTIESVTGRNVQHFSYPFGGRNSVNEREFDIAKTCGFKTIVTTRMGNLFLQHRDHLECLPRLIVGNNYPVIPRFKALESGVGTLRLNKFRRVVTI